MTLVSSSHAQDNGTRQRTENTQNAQTEQVELTADELNARQRIRQTVTVKRRLNGKIIDEQQVEVPDDQNFARRQTEAGGTISDYVRAKVDRQLLTRSEAVSEADVEFTIADTNADGQMTASEYQLLHSFRANDLNYTELLGNNHEETKSDHQNRYAAFEIADRKESRRIAMNEKFQFMVGIAPTLSRKNFIREFLRDFDAMDTNGDYILDGDELQMFRKTMLLVADKTF